MPVIIGGLQLLFGVLVGPFLLAIVGGWLGGDADPTDIRQSVAWSYVPFAVVGLCWIPILLAFGGPPGADPDPQTAFQISASVLLLIVALGVLWSVVLQVITLAEVQRFSIMRAIASIVILLIPMLLLGMF